MGNFRETVVEVNLDAAGGANDVKRVWDAPSSQPIKRMYISLSTGGTVTAALGLDWEVFYGGRWNGKPFDMNSVHTGGVSKGSGTVAGGAEIAEIIHSDEDSLPSNLRVDVNSGSNIIHKGMSGYPIVVELTNQKASPVKVYVTFVSQNVSDQQ